jgi:NTE family protein
MTKKSARKVAKSTALKGIKGVTVAEKSIFETKEEVMTNHSAYQTAIVLQGGGALGAYEYGVLKALYEARPDFTPAVVTGVSIGAITAAVLVGARSDPISALGELWETYFAVFGALPYPVREWSEALLPEESQQAAAMLGNHGMYSFRPDYLVNPCAADSIYDTTPLGKTLEKLVDLKILNESKTRLVVGAVDIASGEFKTFDNRDPGGLSFEHIIASGSLPPNFPNVKIQANGETHHYWDGGLFWNTPLSPAINCLEECGADNADTRRELLVVELFPSSGAVPRDMPGVMNRLSQLLFASKLDLDTDLFVKLNSFIDLALEIDRAVPADCGAIRNNPGYKTLIGHKKIDAFNIIRSEMPLERGNAGDFSKASLDWRIAAGYKDATAQGIGTPKPVSTIVAQLKA